jgi:hypothetical protein
MNGAKEQILAPRHMVWSDGVISGPKDRRPAMLEGQDLLLTLARVAPTENSLKRSVDPFPVMHEINI